jgi:hypothetical protein
VNKKVGDNQITYDNASELLSQAQEIKKALVDIGWRIGEQQNK